MAKNYKKIQEHETEVKEILKSTGCMNKHGQIIRWRADTWEVLNAKGHNSLDHSKCNCCK
jgi:hypothetical protein